MLSTTHHQIPPEENDPHTESSIVLQAELDVFEYMNTLPNRTAQRNDITHYFASKYEQKLIDLIIRNSIKLGFMVNTTGWISNQRMDQSSPMLTEMGVRRIDEIKKDLLEKQIEKKYQKTDYLNNRINLIILIPSLIISLVALVVTCNSATDKKIDETNRLLKQLIEKKADTVDIKK